VGQLPTRCVGCVVLLRVRRGICKLHELRTPELGEPRLQHGSLGRGDSDCSAKRELLLSVRYHEPLSHRAWWMDSSIDMPSCPQCRLELRPPCQHADGRPIVLEGFLAMGRRLPPFGGGFTSIRAGRFRILLELLDNELPKSLVRMPGLAQVWCASWRGRRLSIELVLQRAPSGLHQRREGSLVRQMGNRLGRRGSRTELIVGERLLMQHPRGRSKWST